MNTAELRFLTDENISETVLAYLRHRGHDVLDVKESGLAGYDDEVLLNPATEQNRVIVTHDSDFGMLTLVRWF